MIGGVFLEPEVRSGPMVVLEVGCEDATEMCLADDDHVIEALASDGSDQTLNERILPWTRRSGHDFGDTHASQSPLECVGVDAVSISVQPA